MPILLKFKNQFNNPWSGDNSGNSGANSNNSGQKNLDSSSPENLSNGSSGGKTPNFNENKNDSEKSTPNQPNQDSDPNKNGEQNKKEGEEQKNSKFISPFATNSSSTNNSSGAAEKKTSQTSSKNQFLTGFFTNNSSNSKREKQSKNSSSGQNSTQNFGKTSKKSSGWLEKFLSKIFFEEGNSGNNSGNKNSGDFQQNSFPKSAIGLISLGVVLFWLSLGFFKVDTDENAVLLYFGKFHKIARPGLNYHIPYPFGQVIKKKVSTVNNEEFGFSSMSRSKSDQDYEAESLMLTGDENIVDVQFQVQWQISDVKDFVFNIANPYDSIRRCAESAMREVIAKTPIAEALSDGKQKIEQQTKILLQEVLDSYSSGVKVVLVQLRRVDPPKQVIDSFRDVQTAKADKEREINEAQAYANDIIPRARGTAAQMKEESEAYASQVVANAEGEAARFLSVYNQYVRAKKITKRRIYLETMEKIYRDMDKLYIDKSAPSAFFGQIPGFEPQANSRINSSAANQSELNPSSNISQGNPKISYSKKN